MCPWERLRLRGARKSPVALSPGCRGWGGAWLPLRGRLAAGAGLAGLPRLEAGAVSPEGKYLPPLLFPRASLPWERCFSPCGAKLQRLLARVPAAFFFCFSCCPQSLAGGVCSPPLLLLFSGCCFSSIPHICYPLLSSLAVKADARRVGLPQHRVLWDQGMP